MEYIDNCLYNGVELPKLPENLPHAGRIIVHLESFGYLLVSTNTIPEVSGTAVEWGDNNLSVGYEIVGGEWVAGASGAGSLGSIADGYFLWTNNTIYNSDGSVHLADTAIVRISTDTEEINAGVYKGYRFIFQDSDGNTLADPKATYDLLIINDVTDEILTEADWINMSSFPSVYIYSTSPEHHTVRIMMDWEDLDGLKHRGYKNIIIGEAVAVEPEEPEEPEEPAVNPFVLDLKSFLTGLAFGLSGKPLPLLPAQKEPVAYLYNGVRLPKLPEWDREMYPYAYIMQGGEIPDEPESEYNYAYWLTFLSASAEYFYHSNSFPENEYCFGGDPYVKKCPAIVYGKLQASNEWVFYDEEDNNFIARWVPVFWTNFDLDLGNLKVDASDPIPVYE